jgi:hypothetical protein
MDVLFYFGAAGDQTQAFMHRGKSLPLSTILCPKWMLLKQKYF